MWLNIDSTKFQTSEEIKTQDIKNMKDTFQSLYQYGLESMPTFTEEMHSQIESVFEELHKQEELFNKSKCNGTN